MKQNVLPRNRSLMMITLSILSGLLFVAGEIGGTASLTASPAIQQAQGQFAYVSNNGSQDVTMYQVNQNTGGLQPIGTAPAGSGPQAVAAAPATDPSRFAVSGRPVFVANENSDNISMFTVNPSSGQLTPTGTAPAGDSPQAVAIDPQCQMAIVANGGSNNVSVYSISPANGSLTQVQTVPAGQEPVAVAISPSGNMAFVANQGSSNISVFSINQNGMLTPMGQPVAMPPGSGAPSSVAVLPTGNVVVATSPSTNNMGVFLVNPTPLPGFPALLPVGAFSTGGNGPTSIDIGSNGIAAVTLTSLGGSKNSAQGFGAIALFRISPMGTITPLGLPVLTMGGSGPTDVAVDPGGGFAYVTNRNTNNVSVVAIMPSGFPMPVGTVPAGSSPQGVAVAF